MTEDKKKVEEVKENPDKPVDLAEVDIPEDKRDDVAVKTQEETERGKRPNLTKGTVKPAGDSRGRGSSRPGRQSRGPKRDRFEEEDWDPKTKLGILVKAGKVSSMHDALSSGLPLREHQIVDTIIGEDLVDEVLKVNMVQRMTDSGRRTRFSITVVVGNSNGYVGLGSARGKEVGPTIKKAIDNAKLNMIELNRGCGSWECGCMNPHSLPLQGRRQGGVHNRYT